MSSSINIQNVDRIYTDTDGKAVQALKSVDLDIRAGEFISLIGPSGCGKTTLLRLIAGLDKPQAGQLSIDERKINGASPERGYVFQQGSLFPWLDVEHNIAYGLRARGLLRQKKANVSEYIKMVGLDGFEKSYPHQISGGMAQRVAIARALINEPKALLLDEPMGALDSFTRADLQDKLLELWKEKGTTMILVTHDIDEAILLSDRIVVLTAHPGTVHEIVNVPFDRPRRREELVKTEEYGKFRNRLLSLLYNDIAERIGGDEVVL